MSFTLSVFGPFICPYSGAHGMASCAPRFSVFQTILAWAWPGRAGPGKGGHNLVFLKQLAQMTNGLGRAGQGWAGPGRARQGRAGPGRAGQGLVRARQGRAGPGKDSQNIVFFLNSWRK